MSYIVAENLTKTFGNGDAVITAVAAVSFEIAPGEFVGIMGESGAGKSTLLGILGAMNAPTEGRLRVDGIDVYALSGEQRADFRREYLGIRFSELPSRSLPDGCRERHAPPGGGPARQRPEALHGRGSPGPGGSGRQGRTAARGNLGGEKERVAVARAIVNEPPILLADEPTGNLDTKNSREIMGMFERLNANGMTIIMVTHSPECARHARRILTVSDGRLVSRPSRRRSGAQPRSVASSIRELTVSTGHGERSTTRSGVEPLSMDLTIPEPRTPRTIMSISCALA